jgi:hypothetical protein
LSSFACFHAGMNTVLGPGLGARLSFATGDPGWAATLEHERVSRDAHSSTDAQRATHHSLRDLEASS